MSDQRPTLSPTPLTSEQSLDWIALQRLVWTYCHGIDRRDFALVRSLYHDDAIDDHGSMFKGSPDEYIAWLPSMVSHWKATSHAISNMVFLIDGDHAEGELVTTAWHRTTDGKRDIIAHGRYLDQYRKRDGIWKFYRRALVHDWSEHRTVPEGADANVGIDLGRADADDACYRRLPLFAAQRSKRA